MIFECISVYKRYKIIKQQKEKMCVFFLTDIMQSFQIRSDI